MIDVRVGRATKPLNKILRSGTTVLTKLGNQCLRRSDAQPFRDTFDQTSVSAHKLRYRGLHEAVQRRAEPLRDLIRNTCAQEFSHLRIRAPMRVRRHLLDYS